MKIVTRAAVLAGLVLGTGLAPIPGAALAQTTSADSPATDSAVGVTVETDAEFVRLATSSDILEIRSSEVAQDRAASDAVKGFAARMIADHTAASQALAEAAGQAAPDFATDLSAKLDPRHAEQLAMLEAAAADAGFDQAYVDLQRVAHEEAVALFQTYATNGEEGEVKAFAEATVPKLQEHLAMVQDLRAGP